MGLGAPGTGGPLLLLRPPETPSQDLADAGGPPQPPGPRRWGLGKIIHPVVGRLELDVLRHGWAVQSIQWHLDAGLAAKQWAPSTFKEALELM